MTPVYFDSPAAFRKWLAKNHDQEKEILVGFYKQKQGGGAGKVPLSYAAALDEALCFGWIDGVRKSVDDERWTIRFTPRKPKSYWSAVNLKKAQALIESGRMQPPGLKELAKWDGTRAGKYSFENAPVELAPEYDQRLRANRKALAYFQSCAPWYQRAAKFWVMSAKREETRVKRLALLIEHSAQGMKPPTFTPPNEKKQARDAASRKSGVT